MEATKSLDVIVNRHDYKRLIEQLKERVGEIAKRICKKMQELDVTTVYSNGLKVIVATQHYYGGEYSYLAVDHYGDWESLEEPGCDYYYANDSGSHVQGVPNKRALAFLNGAKNIIEQLSEIEDQKAAEVSKALDDTKDL